MLLDNLHPVSFKLWGLQRPICYFIQCFLDCFKLSMFFQVLSYIFHNTIQAKAMSNFRENFSNRIQNSIVMLSNDCLWEDTFHTCQKCPK
uniref:Uncharacterized protein n=1 Tax=Arundo donax TaxID=35708 RepID=A0A0A9FPJ7_ARUDO